MSNRIGRSATWISFALYLLFIIARLATQDGDISRFIVAGDRFFAKAALTYPIHVEPQSDGYDGQFYYRMALDPLETRRTAFGITMEPNPVVREQRILYPVTIWLLSAGNARLVPYVMVAINFVCLLLIARVGIGLTAHFRVDRRYAVLFPLYPGFLLSLSRDTIEIFATFLALSAVLAMVKRRHLAAALLASAAVLARETTLLYLAGFGVVALYDSVRERRFDVRVAVCAVPLAVFLLWQVVLKSVWGSLPIEDLGPHDLAGVPFVAFGQWLAVHWNEATEPVVRYSHLYTLFGFVLIPAFLAFILFHVVGPRSVNGGIAISWAFYTLLATFFTGAIWIEAYGFLRILCDFYVLGIAMLVSSSNEIALRRLLPVVTATWLATTIYAL